MDDITFQQRIAAMDMLASNLEFNEIPIEMVSGDDQKALRLAYKICQKSDQKKAFWLKDCDLLCCLGKVALRLGWFKEAETFFRSAIAINNHSPNPFYNLGLLLKSQGKTSLADEMFKKTLEIAPDDWDKRKQVRRLLGQIPSARSEQDLKSNIQNKVTEKKPSPVQIHLEANKTHHFPIKATIKTGKCAVCGKLVGSMAYVCKYCGLEHCQDHRIPEYHSCSAGFRVSHIQERKMPSSRDELVKEIARIGELAADKAYIDISTKALSEFDEKILKYASSFLDDTKTQVETLPDDFELWYRAGKVAHRLSWSQIAERFYRFALKYGVEVEAWQNLAKVLEAQGKVSEAEDAYRKVTILDPTNVDAWMRLGNLCERAGRHNDAKVARNNCFKQDPQKAKEYLQNRPWQIYSKLEPEEVYQHRVEEKETDFDAWFGLGFLHYIKWQLPEAEHAFRTGLKYDPKNSEIWNTLGCVLLDQQQIERGEKCYKQSIESDPENFSAHYNLGLICEQNDRTDAAIKEFQVCSELIPRDFRSWAHLCILCKKRGRLDESEVAWEKLRVLEPGIIPYLPDIENLTHIFKPYRDPSQLYM